MRKVKAKAAAPAKKKPAKAKQAGKAVRVLKKQPAQAKVQRARSAKPAKAKVRGGGKAAAAAAKRSAKKPLVAKRPVKKPVTLAKGARKPTAVVKRPVAKKPVAKPLKGAKRPAAKVVAKKPVAKARPVAKKAVAKKPLARAVNKKPVAKSAVRAAAKKPVAAKRVVAKKPVAKPATKVAARKPVAKVAKPVAKKLAPKPSKPVAKVAKPVAKPTPVVAKPAPVPPKPPAPAPVLRVVAPEPVRPAAAPVAPKAESPKPAPVAPKPVAAKPAPKTPKPNPVREAVAKLRARKTPRRELPRLDAPAPIIAPGHSETAVLIRRPQIETPSASARVLAEATARITARRARDMLPVSIATRRLILRSPIRGDVPELVKLADNRNIASKLARLPSPYTRADAIAFVEIFAQRADERAYAITRDGTFIGVVGFSFREGRPPELGYWLGEPHWGQGYMAEAVRGLVDAAHSTGLYGLIGARALEDNQASIAILEKIGFKRVGRTLTEEHGVEKRKIIVFELEAPRWA
jgi:RimJ/RimL family protein N-acetyltransferase